MLSHNSFVCKCQSLLLVIWNLEKKTLFLKESKITIRQKKKKRERAFAKLRIKDKHKKKE